ncbi:hypothetical protein Acr_22g0003480 [Actinidia rufa]|uniref:Uncharacterized protein n=1 Tax=Actinidia rufa TaxID=165716 RepID=A0A7J0GJG4_9ERIC|nr:hypothetical protein Acr_22g0003480 [Actinidia rufa]
MYRDRIWPRYGGDLRSATAEEPTRVLRTGARCRCYHKPSLSELKAKLPRDVKGQKVSYTSKSLLTAPYPDEDVDQIMKGYRPGRRGIVGSAAYSLTQRAAGVSARRAVVCRVTRHEGAAELPASAITYDHLKASVDNNGFGSRETQGKPPHTRMTPRYRGAKQLADTQRTTKAASKQRPDRLPHKADGEGPSRVRSGVQRDPPHEPRKEKRCESNVDLESQGDSKFVASSKRRMSLRRA